ncbi:MAG: aspartyl protease family protein [Chloroflexi bacterium]|nr:aspartyl protease family protein [Chloroflexota bacterium]
MIEMEALVDTGATHTLLPREALAELGIDAMERLQFRLADETMVEYEIGEARLRLDGRQRTTVVIFGPPGAMPLIGATTLELFNLGVDTVAGRLVPVPGLLK